MTYKLGASIALILILLASTPQPANPSTSHTMLAATTSPAQIDLDWLEGKARETLDRNRVLEVRGWNGPSQEVCYHAPYLDPQVDYPQWLPGWLHWLWDSWWQVREPWQVRYPHQWFWDSCAHAIVLSHLDPQLAKREIESLLYSQDETGFIPHMIWNRERMHWVDRLLHWLYPSDHSSPYLQPPALAEAVEHIYLRTGDLQFVQSVLPPLKEYYLYLDEVRDRDGDGLPQIIISYESGKDRSLEYDAVYGESNTKPAWRGPMAKLMLRHRMMGWDIDRIFASNRFQVNDLMFCCIYARNLSALSHLFQAVGEQGEADFFRQKAEQTEHAILSKMYDEETGLFYSLDARHGQDQQIKVSTVSSLMPLVLSSISQPQVERLVDDYLINPDEFWTRYPVPAEPLSSSSQTPTGHIIWRGSQTWVYPNWYIVQGLREQASRFPEHRQEYNRVADELTLKTCELVQKEGFREYYDAESGEGGGAYDFGCSALVLDMVCSKEQVQSQKHSQIKGLVVQSAQR